MPLQLVSGSGHGVPALCAVHPCQPAPAPFHDPLNRPLPHPACLPACLPAFRPRCSTGRAGVHEAVPVPAGSKVWGTGRRAGSDTGAAPAAAGLYGCCRCCCCWFVRLLPLLQAVLAVHPVGQQAPGWQLQPPCSYLACCSHCLAPTLPPSHQALFRGQSGYLTICQSCQQPSGALQLSAACALHHFLWLRHLLSCPC
jgi:hypothetical protein